MIIVFFSSIFLKYTENKKNPLKLFLSSFSDAVFSNDCKYNLCMTNLVIQQSASSKTCPTIFGKIQLLQVVFDKKDDH